MSPQPNPTPSRSGMGAIAHEAGVAFRVWAPNATAVAVVGDWNGWSETADPMIEEQGGYWYADVPDAASGAEYQYRIEGPDGAVTRVDPYARQVTNSVGNAIITDTSFDWGDDDAFEARSWHELVVYELHIGTFNRPDGSGVGTFADAAERLDHLKSLGVNTIQVMPIMEFAGDISWGYNPAHLFAVESAYGGPQAFKAFVRKAHLAGFAVILDVVYNHAGPSDLDLWRFDGAHEGDGGGIYFYQDHRKDTPWGATRFDYGRPEVRQFIRDNALYCLEEFHVDGLRFDMTLYIRTISGNEGDGGGKLPDGWSLMAWLNDEIAEQFPGRITIAEDLRQLGAITAPTSEGGAGFGAQWDAAFVHPVRQVLTMANDDDRSMADLVRAVTHAHNDDAFRRVVYTESHDEVANGKARVPMEIGGADGQRGWAAQKLSSMGAVLVMTAPGIPMIFQGQEFLRGDWFDDGVAVDWNQAKDFAGILRLWTDLIALRLDRDGGTGGLKGRNVDILMADEDRKILAFHRRDGDGDGDVIVVMNFRADPVTDLHVGFPEGGDWRVRLNTDATCYSLDFDDAGYPTTEAFEGEQDGRSHHAVTTLGGYSALIYSR